MTPTSSSSSSSGGSQSNDPPDGARPEPSAILARYIAARHALKAADGGGQELAREADAAAAAAVEAFHDVAVSYARRFTGGVGEYLPAAVVGLASALETYDLSRGSFAFSAYKPIQRELLRAMLANEFGSCSGTLGT